MIPIRDVIPSRTTPVVTLALIAFNTIGYAMTLTSFGGRLRGVLFDAALPTFAANAIALWLFGENVEDRMGRGRFAAFYIVCGAAALGAWVLLQPAAEPAFVSGAVGAIAGAYFMLYPQSRIVMLVPLPLVLTTFELSGLVLLGAWVLAQIASAIAVASWGSGLAAGAALVFVFRRSERLRVEWWNEPPR